MKFSRLDYQESIIDLRTENGLPAGIPAGEPVFLLRAKDKFAPQTVMRWAEFVRNATGDTDAKSPIVASAFEQAKRMQEWQDAHGSQTPTLPGEG